MAETYREVAIAWDKESDPRRANRLHDRIVELYLELVETAEGRGILVALTQGADESVAHTAAWHSLWIEPAVGRATLGTLEHNARNPMIRLSARWTLKEFDEGHLKDPREWYKRRRRRPLRGS
ncbi:MAG: hypothetical protein ACRDHF_08960 [Tepidiformaceae bacterium]